HDLAALLPRDLRELAERFQFGELRFVVRVGDGAGTQTVAEREGDIVLTHDVADFLEMRVEETLLVMREAPLRHDGAASADDAGDALRGERHIGKADARMDREI